ncbi:MAG: DUF4956 domain-containing protein [Lachnospiraceae bacterium]|nr:DUF4956 domain-containing protein [Lachnospiraceae bacterium]
MKKELIKYLVANTGALTIKDVLLNFLVAALIAVVIFLSYRLTHTGAAYSSRFNVSLAMLVLVTTLVMNVIGNNVALSLGMVGALSIVRFRTAVKDSRDTAYIFWCVATGICCGVQEYMIAAVGCAVIFIFLIIFGLIRSSERYLIILRGSLESDKSIGAVVDEKFKGKARLVVHNTGTQDCEYIYEITEKMLDAAGKSGNLIEYLRNNSKVDTVNIVAQTDEISR